MSDLTITNTADAITSSIEQATHARNPLFSDVPSEVLEVVAQYCTPPDVFNLSLTSKEFLAETHCQPPPSSVLFKGGESHELSLMNKLLHVSMLQSLKHTLKENRVSFRKEIDIFKSFTDLANSLPPNSVAMSGSIVVQAVLGVKWEDSDLDVYCTIDSAPAVRSWLINDVKQVLVGVHPACHPGPFQPHALTLAYEGTPVSPSEFIGGVEKWINTPDDGEVFKTNDGRTWRFSKSFCCEPSPIVYNPLANVYRDEIWEVGTKDHATDIPFEPLLLRDEVEKQCNIDLIIASRFYGIRDVIGDFDVEIRKCLWNGHKFIIPNPQLTFRKCSALTESREVRQMRTYMECIARESSRSFHSMMTELRTGGQPKQVPENRRRRLDDKSRNRNFLERFRVITDNDRRAYDDISLVVDHFNIFSEWLDDDELPVSIAWLINMLRVVLMENVLDLHIEGIEGIEGNSVRSFVDSKLCFTKFGRPKQDCINGMHRAACKVVSMHNVVLRSLERVQKYRGRGIEIPLGIGPPKFEGGRALTLPKYPHFSIPPPPTSSLSARLAFLYGEDIDDDEDWEYPSGDPAGRFERTAETTRSNGEASNQERSEAFRRLAGEARREHLMSTWRAHKASIKSLPPMGIVLLSGEEECSDVPGCVVGGKEEQARKRKAESPRGERDDITCKCLDK